jgi:glyoxylate reductase
MNGKDESERPLLLLGTPLRAAVLDRLAKHYRLIVPPKTLTVDTLPSGAEAARPMLTRGGANTPAALINALPNLALIACNGTGYEGVDLAAARARNIAVTNSPGGSAASVADLAIGLMIASARRMLISDRYIRDGRWTVHPPPDLSITPGLTGKRAGIYGLGIIGEKIATRAAAFEMEVAYHGRHAQPAKPYRYFASLLDLAEWSDILVVATRSTPETCGSVNGAVLDALGRAGHVVNVARGAIIDQEALVARLSDGRTAGAGLDVFDGEPSVPETLLKHPNVVLSPHVAGSTEDGQETTLRMVLANLAAFFEGRPLPTPVDAEAV